MTDILITSSVLILALLIIRRVFKNTLSARLRYTLWALVLVRLLVPFHLIPDSHLSVLNATRPAVQAVDHALHAAPVYLEPMEQYPASEYPGTPDASVDAATILWDPVGNRPDGYLALDPGGETVTKYAVRTYYGDMLLAALAIIWKAGMAVVGGYFLFSNLAFYVKLRKTRTEWTPTVSRKVYLVPDGVIPSPCLFGNAIYLTPAALGSEERLRHVLLHEETHARQLDPLWALLRCVCLTVYWFDPLVWAAALCSRADCELACDEAVLKALGETERIPYGQTLLSLIPVQRGTNPLLTATTMTAGKRQLKDRVSRIAQNPRQLAWAGVAVALLAVVLSACTFSEARIPTVIPEPSPVPSPTPTEPEPTTTADHIMAVGTDGAVWAWGSGAPPDHIMAVDADGNVWAWGPNTAALQIQSDLDLIMDHGGLVHLWLGVPSEGPQSIYGIHPNDFGNGRNRQLWFTDPDTFLWSFADAGDLPLEERTTLEIFDDDNCQTLIFTEGSDIVRSLREGQSEVYYRAEPTHPEDVLSQDIFSFMRFWYDEVELPFVRGKVGLIPDTGQSYREIAQAVADGEGEAMLHVTPGSKYAYTYVKAVDVEVIDDMPESWFPEVVLQRFPQHFAFSWSSIFVPENQTSAQWSMAGNTVPYEGDDPDVPEGAFQAWYLGTIVLTDWGWCCYHYGTG